MILQRDQLPVEFFNEDPFRSVERMEPLLNSYTILNSYKGLRLAAESRRKAGLRSSFRVYVASEQFEISDLGTLVVSSPDRNVILS